MLIFEPSTTVISTSKLDKSFVDSPVEHPNSRILLPDKCFFIASK